MKERSATAGAGMSGKTQRQVLAALVVMAVVVLLAAAGCATIPTHGPVGKSDPLAPRNNSVNISFTQNKPVVGASPESIIRGFIESGTGIADDFPVTREFLTPALAQSWAGDKRTLVYKNTFSVAPGKEKDSYVVTFDVVSTVDAMGVLTPAVANAKETVEMKLVQVDGQWRIAQAPDGIVLAEGTFQTLFNPVSLYFYDPTFTYGVPDVRWLAGRTQRTATSIVRAMLDGPAPYLKGVVVSAFPTGMSLDIDSVPVTSGIAKVGLTSQPLLETSVRQRQQMHDQLLVTLQKSLNTITDVQFLANDREVDMGGASDTIPSMIIDNSVPPTQVALAKNELVTYDGTKVAPIPTMESIAALDPSTPAISYSGKHFAFQSGSGSRIYSVVAGQQPEVAVIGTELTPPSFAPNGWLWTASGDGSGTVTAINANDGAKDAVPVVLTVPWLVGQHVTTLRISRDGTRALVIYDSNGVTHVGITGIFKSGDVPKELTVPATMVQSGAPTLGVWVGETSVAVMAPSAAAAVTIEVLDLSRDPVTMNPIKGIEWLSAGSGVRNVHAQTPNELYSLAGNNWEVSVKALRQASFAG